MGDRAKRRLSRWPLTCKDTRETINVDCARGSSFSTSFRERVNRPDQLHVDENRPAVLQTIKMSFDSAQQNLSTKRQ
jgi:hypothetical protein